MSQWKLNKKTTSELQQPGALLSTMAWCSSVKLQVFGRRLFHLRNDDSAVVAVGSKSVTVAPLEVDITVEVDVASPAVCILLVVSIRGLAVVPVEHLLFVTISVGT